MDFLFLGSNFWSKIATFWNFSETLFLHLYRFIQVYRKSSLYFEALILKIQIKVNMHPQGPPNQILIQQISGVPILWCMFFGKVEEGETMKLLDNYFWINFNTDIPEIWRIHLAGKCKHDIEEVIPSKFSVVYNIKGVILLFGLAISQCIWV